MHSETSEQHKDFNPSSESKDNTDVDNFATWVQYHPPFANLKADILMSVSTGIETDNSINFDQAIYYIKLYWDPIIFQVIGEILGVYETSLLTK